MAAAESVVNAQTSASSMLTRTATVRCSIERVGFQSGELSGELKPAAGRLEGPQR